MSQFTALLHRREAARTEARRLIDLAVGNPELDNRDAWLTIGRLLVEAEKADRALEAADTEEDEK